MIISDVCWARCFGEYLLLPLFTRASISPAQGQTSSRFLGCSAFPFRIKVEVKQTRFRGHSCLGKLLLERSIGGWLVTPFGLDLLCS